MSQYIDLICLSFGLPAAQRPRLMSANGRDVTKRAITDVTSIVSGRNYDILTSIIHHLNCEYTVTW